MKRHLIASLLLGFFAVPPPPLFACSPQGCVSPCISDELLNDVNFDQLCSDWVFSNNATIAGGSGGDYYAELIGDDNGEELEQTVTANSGYSSMDLDVGLDINKSSPGTERLKIEITHGSTTDVIDHIYASLNSSGVFHYNLSNYSGQTITIRFLNVTGAHPGDTVWHIQTVVLNAYF